MKLVNAEQPLMNITNKHVEKQQGVKYEKKREKMANEEDLQNIVEVSEVS
jgi:hypothetical protein